MSAGAWGWWLTHLERLRVPMLDLLDTRHVVQVVRELVERLYAVRKTDRQLLGVVGVSHARRWRWRRTGQELRRLEERALRWVLPKEHHLLQRNWNIALVNGRARHLGQRGTRRTSCLRERGEVMYLLP